jgi:hypothetical protein
MGGIADGNTMRWYGDGDTPFESYDSKVSVRERAITARCRLRKRSERAPGEIVRVRRASTAFAAFQDTAKG